MNDYNGNHDLSRALETLAKRRSQVVELGLDDLFIDRRFQRPLNTKHAENIAASYHPAGLGFLLGATVVNDDGSQAAGENGEENVILDGQTRLYGLRMRRENEERDGRKFSPLVKIELFKDLTQEEAAVLFSLRNDQKPIRPEDRDQIGLEAGDPVMKEVIRQANATGYRVFTDDPDKEPVNMPHRDHAKRIVQWGRKQGRPDLLGEVLGIQAQAFSTEVGYLNKDLMTATAEMMRKHENLNEAELVRILTTIGLPGVVGQAEQESARSGKRMSGAMQIVLRTAYNKGKRGDDVLRGR